MNIAYRVSVADHLEQDTLDIGVVVTHPDYAERVTAFMNRQR